MIEPDTREHERIILAITCSEKSSGQTQQPCLLAVTPSRIILSPIYDLVRQRETPSPASAEKSPGSTKISWRGWLSGHIDPVPDFEALLKEFRTRAPEEILASEKDAREIRFENISDVTVRRVRNAQKNSRLRSFILSPYPFEPASARYAVDYQLTVTTPEKTYTLLTPFRFELKQVLVNGLGDRVHEIIDPNAPLL